MCSYHRNKTKPNKQTIKTRKHIKSLGGDGCIYNFACEDGITGYPLVHMHQDMCAKYVQIFVYEVYLNKVKERNLFVVGISLALP